MQTISISMSSNKEDFICPLCEKERSGEGYSIVVDLKINGQTIATSDAVCNKCHADIENDDFGVLDALQWHLDKKSSE